MKSCPNSGPNMPWPMLNKRWSERDREGRWSACISRGFNSPYPGCGIDISGKAAAYPTETQEAQSTTLQTPLLHIAPQIVQNTPPYPSFNSPYRGGDFDITGGAIFSWPEPQPVTSSAVRTAVLHIASPIQHIGAHHRQPALRVRDSSGKPGGLSSGRGLEANSPTRGFARGTPEQPTN